MKKINADKVWDHLTEGFPDKELNAKLNNLNKPELLELINDFGRKFHSYYIDHQAKVSILEDEKDTCEEKLGCINLPNINSMADQMKLEECIDNIQL